MSPRYATEGPAPMIIGDPTPADLCCEAAERPFVSETYDTATIRQLNALTSEFYAREAASFSATRQSPWHGWEHAWKVIAAAEPAFAAQPLSVLDLGCGNLRFEWFLAERAAGPLAVTAIDNCAPLVKDSRRPVSNPARPNAAGRQCTFADSPENATPPHAEEGPAARKPVAVDFRHIDIVESLLEDALADCLPRSICDLAVAFGLMHHLPTFALRARVLQELISALRPGGFAIVSFWQLLNDARIAAKAATTTAEGRAERDLPPFQENDFLLGWQEAQHVYRFCHHTDDSEIDALLAALQANPDAPPFHEVARFSADGKQGSLNRYVILQRA